MHELFSNTTNGGQMSSDPWILAGRLLEGGLERGRGGAALAPRDWTFLIVSASPGR